MWHFASKNRIIQLIYNESLAVEVQICYNIDTNCVFVRYIIVLNNNLFEVMGIVTHCDYVSDLRNLEHEQKHNLAVFIETTVAADVFSESQWRDALSYIANITVQSDSDAIRRQLVSFLRENNNAI